MNEKQVTETPFEPERYELYAEPHSQFLLDRREFFQVLGGGIVVCLVLGDALAQQPGRGRGGFERKRARRAPVFCVHVWRTADAEGEPRG